MPIEPLQPMKEEIKSRLLKYPNLLMLLPYNRNWIDNFAAVWVQAKAKLMWQNRTGPISKIITRAWLEFQSGLTWNQLCQNDQREKKNKESQRLLCWFNRLCNQSPQVPILFIFKPSAIPKRQVDLINGKAWRGIGSLSDSLVNSFHGFKAVTAALETKGSPADGRWLWIYRSCVNYGTTSIESPLKRQEIFDIRTNQWCKYIGLISVKTN
jgi:hypothetical protein